jgi:AcrR family transcriptional regulator
MPAATTDDQLRGAILGAAVDLCRTHGYARLSLAAIADRAGVEVATLQRWWQVKGAVVIEAFRRVVGRDLGYPDTGDFAADLREQLTAVVRIFADPFTGRVLAEVIADAQHDPLVAEAFLRQVFGPNRAAARQRFQLAQEQGQLRQDLDLDAAIDLTFSPIWFRLLLRTGPLTPSYADTIVALALEGLRQCLVPGDNRGSKRLEPSESP